MLLAAPDALIHAYWNRTRRLWSVRIGYRLAEPGFRRRDTGAVIARAEVVWLEADGSAWALNPS